jgi:hypothetical protein
MTEVSMSQELIRILIVDDHAVARGTEVRDESSDRQDRCKRCIDAGEALKLLDANSCGGARGGV